MEADGSDPEDHQKQLQMTALSRTARNIVAQDFHKAGGGVRPLEMGVKRSVDPVRIAKSLFANKGCQQTFIRDLEEFIVRRLISDSTDYGAAVTDSEAGDDDVPLARNKSLSAIKTPPPAKRLRYNSHHDKENQSDDNQAQQSKATAQQMRDIFEMMTKHYSDMLQKEKDDTCSSKSSGSTKESLGDLERILRNNRELTVSIKDISRIKCSNGDSGLDEEEEDDEDMDFPGKAGPRSSKRKCFVPRKISFDLERKNRAIWNKIRDKHLSRLMSKKKSCYICAQSQSSFNINIPHHTASSLILHKIFRHSHISQKCSKCDLQFKLPYQLRLHYILKHRFGK